MSPERYEQAVAIFHELSAMPAGERALAIASRCGGDPDVRRMVEGMLRAEEGTGFLDPAGIGLLAAAALEEREGPPPERLGAYTLIRKVGGGGMGVVYEAAQENPSRRVAVKVMRPGLIAASTVKRFEREIAIAGRLCFPGIAQVYEAGVHRDERGAATPYFSMELVEGAAIDVFCERELPRARDRVELMASVCDAVAYAHANGVIHRDLKPANVLVTRDATGKVAAKVLDFGVARLAEAQAQTVATEAGQVVGTLAYMSPEQVTGGDVGPASDVYALGVMLFEVLAGRSPYPRVPSTVAEAVKTVCEAEPTRLGRISRPLAGDLETIIGHAMEKDPGRRYSGAAALAEDLRRYLRDEPILARPPTMAYTVRKFARRNPGLVGVVTGAFIMLASALGVVGRLAYLEARSRGEAEASAIAARQQVAVTDAVNAFINDSVLLAAIPERMGKDATILQSLDALNEERMRTLHATPLAEGLVRFSVGAVYNQTEQFAKAEPHLKRAVELLEVHAPGSTKLAEAVNQLGLLISRRNAGEAIPYFRRAAELFQQGLGEGSALALGARANTANALAFSGNRGEALAESARIIETVDRLGLGAPRAVRTAIMLRARIYRDLGDRPLVLTTFEDLRARAERAGVKLEPDEANGLGSALMALGRATESLPIFEEAYASMLARAGVAHSTTRTLAFNLGWNRLMLGDFVASAEVLAEPTEAHLKMYGGTDRRTILHAAMRCDALQRAGRNEDAEALSRRVFDANRGGEQFAGSEGRLLIGPRIKALLALGRKDDAAADLREFEGAAKTPEAKAVAAELRKLVGE